MKSISTDIEEQLIIKQVEKICSCDDFKPKDLLCQFLSYIVSEYLAGRGKKLKGYNIGVDVFNRGEDFDPGQDALVRIHAGRLRRALDLYYLKEGKKDKIKIEIPKGAYSPRFTHNKIQEIAPINQSIDRNKHFSSLAKVAIKSFVNLSTDELCHHFSFGLSEELSVELTKYEDLSVYNFNHWAEEGKSESDLKNKIKASGIRFVVGGTLNKIANRVKIIVHLTDSDEDRQIWGESFFIELTVENLFELQEKISKEVAIKIGSEYGVILQKMSFDLGNTEYENFDIYSAVLKFYYFQIQQTEESAEQAYIALNHVITENPESGIPYALLGTLYGHMYILDLPGAQDSFNTFNTLVEKAMKLSPSSMIVKSVHAFKCFANNQKECFFQLAEDCLSSNQNSSLKTGSTAMYLSLYGQWEKGKSILDSLREKNIVYPSYFLGITMLYYYRKEDYQKALVEANKYILPTVFWAPMLRIAVLGQLGKTKEIQKNIDHLKKLKPEFEDKAVYLLGLFIKEESLVNHVLEGLRKAGMKV